MALKGVEFRNKPKARRVPLCEIKYPLVTDDPDYAVVSYRYVWKVDGRVVRDVTIAAHSDALATDLFAKGDRLECTVTPTDGDLRAPSKSVRSKVRLANAQRATRPGAKAWEHSGQKEGGTRRRKQDYLGESHPA